MMAGTGEHPNKVNFREGLALIFARWPAYQMALQMEWGGSDTVEKDLVFKNSMVDYFDRGGKAIECEDIEEIILEVMSQEFGTLLEDESEREIAKLIWTLFRECIQGQTILLEKMRRLTKPIDLSIVKPSSPDDLSEAEDETEDETDNQQMEEL